MSARLAELLTFALEKHGVPCQRQGAGVELETAPLGFICEEGESKKHSSALVMQINIGAQSPLLGERVLWCSFAGVGPDEDSALKNGFEKFLRCQFHVILGALGDHVCDTVYEEWRIVEAPAGFEWRICDSPLLTQGIADPEGFSFGDAQSALTEAFVASAPAGVHWVEVFFAFLNGERNAIDAHLDGEPWPEGAEVLERWEYQPQNNYESGRYFFIAMADEI